MDRVSSARQIRVHQRLPLGANHKTGIVFIANTQFDSEELAISEKDKEALRSITLREGSHLPHSPKYCGEFHTDYAILWIEGEDLGITFICFTCKEWKSYIREGFLYEDMDSVASSELRKILQKS